jgi:adenylate kinase
MHYATLSSVSNDCCIGVEAEAMMSKGELVPDSMILRLIRNAMTTEGWLIEKDSTQPKESTSSAPSYTHSDLPDASFIIDGFPRTASQASQLDALIPINFAIHVHTPTGIILDRICNRWIHPASGRTYNTTFNPPKVEGVDDVTGEKLVQRDDDKPEVWKARLKQFEDAAMPLLEHYDKMGVLWKVVGNSSDEISPKIFKEFEARFGS